MFIEYLRNFIISTIKQEIGAFIEEIDSFLVSKVQLKRSSAAIVNHLGLAAKESVAFFV